MECTGIDLNKLCRTCKKEATGMKSLYYRITESGKESPRLDEMLMACASVQVDTEDSLPKLICRSCFVQLKNAYTFKEQCEKTDVFLRNYLQTIKHIKVENELLDFEFTTSEVVCDVPPRLSNENGDREKTDPFLNDYGQNVKNIKEETGPPDFEFIASTVVCEIKPPTSRGESTNRDTIEAITGDPQVQLDERVEKDDTDYIQIVDNNVTIYKCRVCSKEFYTLEGIRCHKRLHTSKAFKCKQCNRCYTRLSQLQRHELSHSKRKMHVCKVCTKSFTKYAYLKSHLITHLKDRPFSCPLCNRGFTQVQRFRNHVTICKGKKAHVCNVCNKAFLREDNMKIHKRLHENKDPVLPTAENLNKIEEHYMKIEHDDETNAVSDEDFYVVAENMEPEVEVLENNNQMKIDEITQLTNDIYAEGDPPEMLTSNGNDYESDNSAHSEYKPTKQSLSKIKRKFQCKTCEKTFISKSHLTEHMKFHNESSKTFLCSECGQMFMRHDYLIIHMRRHREEKPFKCKFCGKGFPRATDLTVHERYHTGEKTHLCVVCGKGFGRACNLTIHMRTHNGERPYGCRYCDAAFAQGNDLKAHVRRHTGERFHCELCPETFLMGYLLTQHKRVVHGLDIVGNIRRLQPVQKLNPGDPPPVTVPLSVPIIVSNTLTSDPLQINEDDMRDLKQE